MFDSKISALDLQNRIGQHLCLHVSGLCHKLVARTSVLCWSLTVNCCFVTQTLTNVCAKGTLLVSS